MKEILFASRNEGKIQEARALLRDCGIKLYSIDDFPGAPEVDENGTTFYENALKKAETLSKYAGLPAIADDSGLEVNHLEGRPGVHSSRYAGENATDADNISLLLKELEGVPSEKRGAAFRCVLVLYKIDGSHRCFEGSFEGTIALKASGTGGFGYDPVFLPADDGRTLAELAPEEKNRISHRGRAFEKLKQYINNEL